VSPEAPSEVTTNYFVLTVVVGGGGAGWDAQAPNPSAAAATAMIAMTLIAFMNSGFTFLS
jgi:hypothetical protein